MLPLLAAAPAVAGTPPITTGISPIDSWSGEFFGLVMDSDGAAYLGGNQYGAGVTFGSTVLAPTGGYDVFVAKNARDGSWAWATTTDSLPTPGSNNGYGFSLTDDGDLVTTSDGITGNFTLTGSATGLIAVDASTGAWAWGAGPPAGPDNANASAAVPGGNGAVVYGGTATPGTTITLGAHVINATAGSCPDSCDNPIIAGLAADHTTWSWVATATPLSGGLAVNGVKAYDDGSVLVSGYMRGSYDFGGHVVTMATAGTFFAKLGADHSTWEWATAVEATNEYFNGHADNVAAAPDGSAYVLTETKSSGAPAVFGSTTLTNADGRAVVAKLNSDGTWAWAKPVGGSTIGWGVAYQEGCGVLLTGGFTGTGTFGSTSLTAEPTGGDGFIAAVDPSGAWSWAQNYDLTDSGSTWNYTLWTVAAQPDGSIAVAVNKADAGKSFGTIPVGTATAFLGRLLAVPCIAPKNVAATAGAGKATISWDEIPGGAAKTYTVTAGPGGKTCTATSPATTCVIDGLTNGTEYSFTVTADNAAGAGPASDAVVATPTGGSSPKAKPSVRIVSARVVGGSRFVARVRVSRAGAVRVSSVLGGVPGCVARATAKRAGFVTVSCVLGESARARIVAGPVVLRVSARLGAAGAVARDASRVRVAQYAPTPVTG